MPQLFQFDWPTYGRYLFIILTAFVLALPIGWERETSTRIMGLRTFPLVALASCTYVLLALIMFANDDQAQARVLQGLITGIGFIGGGAILKHGTSVYGTATAASVWMTGAIGAAVAFEHFELGITLSILTFLTLRVLTGIEQRWGTVDEAVADTVHSREGHHNGREKRAAEAESERKAG